jgi:organic radical activating enzyme
MAVNQKPFFGKRGGVTFSGGEPTSQAKDLIPLVDRLHEEGINVCIDTNGGVWNPAVEELFKKIDLALLDIKQINPARHESLTGRSNSQTLATAKWLEENGKSLDWLVNAGCEVGVAWQDGRAHGGETHIRINLALPLTLVEEAFRRLDRYVFNAKA